MKNIILKNYCLDKKIVIECPKEKPAIKIKLINPLNQKSIIIDEAIIDSGADSNSAPANYAIFLGYKLD